MDNYFQAHEAQTDDQLACSTELTQNQWTAANRGRGRPRKVDQGGGSGSGRRRSRRPRPLVGWSRRKLERVANPPGIKISTTLTRKGGAFDQCQRWKGFSKLPWKKYIYDYVDYLKKDEFLKRKGQSRRAYMEGIPAMEDITRLCFRDEAWLQAFPLDSNLVFDYFALSPFYDYDCNNQQLRESSIHPFDLSLADDGLRVRPDRSKGAKPVCYNQTKEGWPEAVTPVATYYVLDGSVYQAPPLHNVLEARMGRVMHHLSNAFKTLEKIGDVGSESNGPATNLESTIGSRERRDENSEQASRVDNVLRSLWSSLPPAPPPPPFAEGYIPSEAEVEKELKCKHRRLY